MSWDEEDQEELAMRHKDFREAQAKMYSAAVELNQAWEKLGGECYCEGYPFPYSFEEVLADIGAWVEKSK